MQYQLDDCSHLVIILAKKNARYDTPFFRDVAVRKGLQGEQLEKALAKYKGLQEVEMKTAESERALFDWTSKQTYIALANMLTGAAAIGVDSCPIEGFNYDKMNEVLAAEGFNGIPVALLGFNNPLGVIFAALFIAYINLGGNYVQAVHIAVEIIDVIVAAIIYFSSFTLFIRLILERRKGRKKDKKQALIGGDE